MKVAVITPIPTPYRDAFWNHFCQQPDLSLHVIYCAKGKADRPWKSDWTKHYTYCFPKGFNLLSWKSKDSSLFFNPGTLTHLNQSKPDVILVNGYNHLTMWMTMIWAFIRKTPFLLMSETRGLRPGRKKDPLLKALLLKWLAKHSSGALPTGQQAESYLLDHGWNKASLFRFPNVPDIDFLISKVHELKHQTMELRSKWNIKEEKLVLCVGRLIRKKHVNTIIQAFSEMEVPFPVKLIVAGDGDQQQSLKEQCQRLGITDRVRFVGFLEPEEILEWLALSDLFALASNETWGVAPIEAAAAGAPLLLSCEIGSANELADIYPQTKVIASRDAKTWSQAIKDCLINHVKKHPKTADNSRMYHWHFDSLSQGLYRHLKPLIEVSSSC
jgi:glycosyltransferase involved in cell wall biosynthesis